MTLAQPSDGGITRHLANAVGAMGYQCRPRSHPRRSMRRFRTGVSAADHHDIETVGTMFHVKQLLLLGRSLLSETEGREHRAQNILGADPANQALKRPKRGPNILGNDLSLIRL